MSYLVKLYHYFRNPLGGMIEYFCDPDFVTEKWKPTNYRVNRFSEWHLADGIQQAQDLHARPSLAMARAIDNEKSVSRDS